MNLILAIHAFSCWFMLGVIWVIQILVYPNFLLVGRDDFQRLHRLHTNRITWIVAPIMLVELVSGAWLFYLYQTPLFLGNLISVMCVWALTAFVNVPTHNNLRFELEASKKKLVRRNWPRTLIWTLRSLFLVWIVYSQN